MQFSRFTNGGYVLHKMRGYWSGSASAWFDRNGAMIEAEQITPAGVSRPIRRGGPMWAELQRIGNRYKHIPTLSYA